MKKNCKYIILLVTIIVAILFGSCQTHKRFTMAPFSIYSLNPYFLEDTQSHIILYDNKMFYFYHQGAIYGEWHTIGDTLYLQPKNSLGLCDEEKFLEEKFIVYSDSLVALPPSYKNIRWVYLKVKYNALTPTKVQIPSKKSKASQ